MKLTLISIILAEIFSTVAVVGLTFEEEFLNRDLQSESCYSGCEATQRGLIFPGTYPVQDGCFKIEDGDSFGNYLPGFPARDVTYPWPGSPSCSITLSNLSYKDDNELLSFDWTVNGDQLLCCVGLTEVKYGNEYYLHGDNNEPGSFGENCFSSVSYNK